MGESGRLRRLVVVVVAVTLGSAACTLGPTAGPGAGPTGGPASPSAAPSSAGDGSAGVPSSTSTGPASVPPARPGSALAALARLPVKGRAPKTGYARAAFGQAWADVDGNGCDTRDDILRRDLAAVVLRPAARACIVLSGILRDPYTGDTVPFRRGVATSRLVQIDHVVALADAWQKGAQQLSPARRLAFANDPLNLLAVGGAVNDAKGDGDAATWLPPLRSSRCAYVARQVAVKAAYGLWVTQAERDAIARVLATCPAQPLPTR